MPCHITFCINFQTLCSYLAYMKTALCHIQYCHSPSYRCAHIGHISHLYVRWMLTCASWGMFGHPLWFSQMFQKQQCSLLPFLAHLLAACIFSTHLKVSNPGCSRSSHQVAGHIKWPHFRKVWTPKVPLLEENHSIHSNIKLQLELNPESENCDQWSSSCPVGYFKSWKIASSLIGNNLIETS